MASDGYSKFVAMVANFMFAVPYQGGPRAVKITWGRSQQIFDFHLVKGWDFCGTPLYQRGASPWELTIYLMLMKTLGPWT